MKAVIQRVLSASVTADGEPAGKIGKGLLVLLGVTEEDTEKEAELLASKVSSIRIFTDDEDKMNLSVSDVKGNILVVSNFTLCADSKRETDLPFPLLWSPKQPMNFMKNFAVLFLPAILMSKKVYLERICRFPW